MADAGAEVLDPTVEWSPRRLLATVVAVLLPAFLATAAWSGPYHIDPLTNAFTASAIARTGSPILEGYEELATPEQRGVTAWIVPSPRGPVSQYPPGTALVAALPYLFAGPGEVVEMSGTNDPDLPTVSGILPPLWPAAVAASLATALAAGLLALSLQGALGTRRALTTALVTAAGTGLWLNGSHELWQHGVAAMWVALGCFAASRARWATTGLALGAAVLTRPPLAVVAAVLGCWQGWRERSVRPTLLVGLGATTGLAALLAYNLWLWQELTLSGGYGSGFVDIGRTAGLAWYAQNLWGALVSLDRGILVWSPMVAVAVVGLPRVWRDLPSWMTGSFLGGLAVLLVQYRLNRYSGGGGFFSYRYAVEGIVAMTPALGVAGWRLVDDGGPLRTAVLVATVSSVLFHLVAVGVELTV